MNNLSTIHNKYDQTADLINYSWHDFSGYDGNVIYELSLINWK